MLGAATQRFLNPEKPLSRPSARLMPPGGWWFATGGGVEVADVPISVTARFLCLALYSGSTLAAWLLRLVGLDSRSTEAVRRVEVAAVPISVTARFLCLADLDSGSTLAAWLLRLIGLDSKLTEAVRMVGASAFSSVTPAEMKSSASAAAFDRSMMRPATKGPRSLIRTTTE